MEKYLEKYLEIFGLEIVGKKIETYLEIFGLEIVGKIFRDIFGNIWFGNSWKNI